jgi:hypothetical protein
MSAGYPDRIGPFTQGREEKLRAHPARAGNPDDPDIGRIFHPADSGQIRRPVTAPVAQKTDDFGFKLGHYLNSFASNTGHIQGRNPLVSCRQFRSID